MRGARLSRVGVIDPILGTLFNEGSARLVFEAIPGHLPRHGAPCTEDS